MVTAVKAEVPIVLLINGYNGPGFKVTDMTDRERLCLVDLLQQHYVEAGMMHRGGMLLMASFECRERPSKEAQRLATNKGMRLADGGAAFNRRADIERPIDMVDLNDLDKAISDVREVYKKI